MSAHSAEWFRKNHEGRPDFRLRIRRFLQIFKSASDVWLMVSIVGWALVLPVVKRLLPLQAVARKMWSSPKERRTFDQEQKVATIVRWIYSFVFSEGTCVERSLILYRYLSRMSADPQLVTGMRRTGQNTWEGHAWILLDGKPFEEARSSVEDFHTLAIFGPAGKTIP